MTPELTIVMMFQGLLILLTVFPIAFCIRRFEHLARVASIMTARGNHVSTLWRQIMDEGGSKKAGDLRGHISVYLGF